MPSPVPQQLIDQATKNIDAEAAAVGVLNGFAARLQAAVDAATANGATAAELQPVSDEIALLKNSAEALGAAVVANTPAA